MKENIMVILASATFLAPLLTYAMNAIKKAFVLKGNVIPLISILVGAAIGVAYGVSFGDVVLATWAGAFAGMGSVTIHNVQENRKGDK